MKKLSIILVILVSIFALNFSCEKENKEDTTSNTEVTNTTTNTNTEVTNTTTNTNITASNTQNNEGKVVALTTETFKELVFDYTTNQEWTYNGSIPCIIDFYADWCRPCKMVAPIMEELAKDYNGKVNFYKINVDNNSEVASLFGVNSIPAVLFVPLKDKPQMAVGAMPKETYIQAIKDVFNVQ